MAPTACEGPRARQILEPSLDRLEEERAGGAACPSSKLLQLDRSYHSRYRFVRSVGQLQRKHNCVATPTCNDRSGRGARRVPVEFAVQDSVDCDVAETATPSCLIWVGVQCFIGPDHRRTNTAATIRRGTIKYALYLATEDKELTKLFWPSEVLQINGSALPRFAELLNELRTQFQTTWSAAVPELPLTLASPEYMLRFCCPRRWESADN